MKNKGTILFLMLGVSSVSIIAMSGGASAQVVESARPNEVTLDEIVVTATRRDSSLQKVPLSISALAPEKINTLGIKSSNDIAAITPGLSFIDGGNGDQQLTVRGIVVGGGEATTAFYVDDTPISQRQGSAYTPRFFDIERIEVLRGPQGTLYGASSMGGAVRLITAKPNLTKLEGGIRAEGSTTRFASANFVVDGALSIPIVTNKLALRVNGFYEKESGWTKRFIPTFSDDPADYVDLGEDGLPDNGITDPADPDYDPLNQNDDISGVPFTGVLSKAGKRTGDQKVFGGRAALRFDPIDTVSLTASYAYQERRNEGFNTSDTSVKLGFVEGGFNQVRPLDEFRIAQSHLANLTAQVDLGFAKLTSSSSYQRDRQSSATDVTVQFLPTVVSYQK